MWRGTKAKVLLNKIQIGDVGNGDTKEFNIPNGNHELSINCALYYKSDIANFTINGNESAKFQIEIKDAKSKLIAFHLGNLSILLLMIGLYLDDELKLKLSTILFIGSGVFLLKAIIYMIVKPYKILIIKQ